MGTFLVSGFRFQVSSFRLDCIVEAAVSGRCKTAFAAATLPPNLKPET
jgi:hypothetical protein